MTENEFDQACRKHMVEERTSYAQAAQYVATSMRLGALACSERIPTSEAAIDAAAQVYVVRHGVEYAQALDCVLAQGRLNQAVMFSEPDLSNELHLDLATKLHMARRGLDTGRPLRSLEIANLKQQVAQFSQHGEVSDELADAQAKLFALEKGCSYETAVAAQQAQQQAALALQFSHQSNDDEWALHAQGDAIHGAP